MFFLVFPAGALATSISSKIGFKIVALGLLALVIIPIHDAKIVTADNYVEHKLSETMIFQASYATTGYWRNYPDSFEIISEESKKLFPVLLNEVRAKRITYHTRIIHIAESHQVWVAIPVAIFTGIPETMACKDFDPNDPHAYGANLMGLTDLEQNIPKYNYVLLDATTISRESYNLLQKQYEEIYSTNKVTLYRKTSQ